MRKSVILLLLLTVAVTMLTGCSAHGRLYGKSKVLNYMEKSVPREEFTFESKEKVDDADVSTEIYHFRSKERDLEFTAINTRSSIFTDAAIYQRTIIPKYIEGVHELYREDTESILNNSGLKIDNNRIYIDSYENLVCLAEYFAAADDVYKKELNYNSEDWMIENPLKI